MPRPPKPKPRTLAPSTLIIDNGAYTLKAGFSTPTPDPATDCHLIPNCLARDRSRKTWIGADLYNATDYSEMLFRRPVEKGYVVNWEAQKEIWDRSFFDAGGVLKCDPHETNLILTEAPNAPQALQTNTDQIVFEEYEFASYYRCVGASLNAYTDTQSLFTGSPSIGPASTPTECLLVLDSGYSSTTITPLYQTYPLHPAIRRLNIGGHFLTNVLKDLVSQHQFYMMDETHLMTEIKESVCYVSPDFPADLQRTWKGNPSDRRTPDPSLIVDYILPDYSAGKRGYRRPHEPSLPTRGKPTNLLPPSSTTTTTTPTANENIMTLSTERFSVPELLFHPSDVGLAQVGAPDLVMQSLANVPRGMWPAFLANVLVVGGNSLLEGFVERLARELRMLAPEEMLVRVHSAVDPIKSTWLGGAHLANDHERLRHLSVSRQEYLEYGAGWVARRFAPGGTGGLDV
ncbi:MAG: Actin- protein 6 [Vezdaea acicularis]|nr:MAG: Actin- protein 6 [Vezdaea acicularis]